MDEKEDGEALKGRDLGPGLNFRAMPPEILSPAEAQH